MVDDAKGLSELLHSAKVPTKVIHTNGKALPFITLRRHVTKGRSFIRTADSAHLRESLRVIVTKETASDPKDLPISILSTRIINF